MTLPDYYRILGVTRNASHRTIRRAYRDAALKHHPDNSPEHLRQRAEQRFKLIGQAYRTLSDPAARRRYDFRWQQYVAYVGPERFIHPEDPEAPAQKREMFWGDAGQGPGFYRRVTRSRDEVRILVVSCLLGLLVAAGLLGILPERFAAAAGRTSPDPADLLAATLSAQGFYLLVLFTTAGVLLATRQSLRKLAELRSFSRLLTRQGEILPPNQS
jgi:curved DNA-binding protein CbpA